MDAVQGDAFDAGARDSIENFILFGKLGGTNDETAHDRPLGVV